MALRLSNLNLLRDAMDKAGISLAYKELVINNQRYASIYTNHPINEDIHYKVLITFINQRNNELYSTLANRNGFKRKDFIDYFKNGDTTYNGHIIDDIYNGINNSLLNNDNIIRNMKIYSKDILEEMSRQDNSTNKSIDCVAIKFNGHNKLNKQMYRTIYNDQKAKMYAKRLYKIVISNYEDSNRISFIFSGDENNNINVNNDDPKKIGKILKNASLNIPYIK